MSQRKDSKRIYRTLIVGDVHGCYAELMDLLDKAQLHSDDQIVLVGDLINRGPNNRQVLDFVHTARHVRSVLGNHEHNLLRYYNGALRTLKYTYASVISDLGKDLGRYMEFLAHLPYTLELEEALIVHAGIRPGIPLAEQDPDDLVNLRALAPEGIPWYEFYSGKKPIVFGHWVRLNPLVLKNAIGLDTGCVYGGRLTGVMLPGFDLVSVPARKVYAHKSDKAYLIKHRTAETVKG